MWEMDHKEDWAPKTLDGPLDWKEIKPVNPKGNQLWIFIERTDVEAYAPILWSPNVKRWLTGKDPDAGKDWGQEQKGATEDEMLGWHQLSGHEFEQTQKTVKDSTAWHATVHGVAKSLTRLNNTTTTTTTINFRTFSSPQKVYSLYGTFGVPTRCFLTEIQISYGQSFWYFERCQYGIRICRILRETVTQGKLEVAN